LGSCKYNREKIAIKPPYNFIKFVKVKCIFLTQHHNILGIREMFKNTVTLRVTDNNASPSLIIVILSVRN
jgi:hypothetical protein